MQQRGEETTKDKDYIESIYTTMNTVNETLSVIKMQNDTIRMYNKCKEEERKYRKFRFFCICVLILLIFVIQQSLYYTSIYKSFRKVDKKLERMIEYENTKKNLELDR